MTNLTVVNNEVVKVPFSALKTNEAFQYNNLLYVKIRTQQNCQNAFCLNSIGKLAAFQLDTFSPEDEVAPIKDMEITIS